ncbi:IucA/IucC family siderophore biosynthesis protein [Streptomyces filamentosus]|uniref:IucA/IucC family siderophore biosynthesis protein n=2 Tax=Streptomyces filamentosus TaxID=67294 RepID=A0ABY4UUP0_STRFL|nr:MULTISPECIES: IucA/IucC family siderophore biosynthesis protein [Streptomyces]EFE76453.1 siderophore biosynthetic enzyme [Streptomyces filamentosus NRRL 15998]ESU51206.1 siderophore biosynthetic enzyme [Streptomyces sp. HCCB10043]EWS93425.1 siderophore biosynthetic enzyme [Streptomyces filamentosus NRRL 11379]MYR80432.1 IucA/IucC family siderophore biosynthesis protein [Streptomyces sp. SID5466]USC48046.1 IucA/IucC family siderophore biosynthesis protein [Streptomyces filamentosus]
MKRDVPVAHLTPVAWAAAGRSLIAKALSEFTHERLFVPQDLGEGRYRVLSDDASVAYHYKARVLALNHWQVDASSISRQRTNDNTELPLDPLEFFCETRATLGLSDQVLPVYLEEISSTLASSCYKAARPALTADQLAKADFQAIETGMSEGHPCFVANNGRLGFGGDEYAAYAPEAGHPLRLVWLAARRDRSAFTAGVGVDYETLLRDELGEATVERFRSTLRQRGLDTDDYLFMPVHPWQWHNKLSVTFAAEIAREHLVYVGEGDDEYLAQQSIRTFFNITNPTKHYVKTSLSVINMGFMRGLSAAYMAATPAINDWLAELIEEDELLRDTGLTIIRELATTGYRHLEFEAATDRFSPYRKMLAALWRESPVPSLGDGERPATMASLLHVDREGKSVVGALIAQSGLSPAAWLRRYLRAYLKPLLHCYYAYELAFMPHGENVILVLDAHGAVSRVIFKDIAEEIIVMDQDRELPPEVERIRVDLPELHKILPIFTDVFDGFFRFLSAILDTEGVLEEEAFWQLVAECVTDYQQSMPRLKEQFEKYDMFAPEFPLSCHNRLQIRDNKQMVDLLDPSSSVQLAGTLRNPIA